ncbi:MAG TPA: ribosome silencing factor [Burkholderiales bacterium]|nr:ribosome silencing factor [Burkholderiales bacterium]
MRRVDRMTKAAVAALEDIKGREIVVLDVTPMTAMFDRMVICTADSARQTKALANSVHDKLKAMGYRVQSTEGEQTGDWVLVDLGEIVVHIMQPATRQYYNLEELWAPAKPRRTRSAAPAAKKAATRAKQQASA